MKLYFAYGANLNMASMAQRCPDAVPIQPFYLEDHRLAFSGVATVLPLEGSKVPGALWAISDEDEKALDRFEGYPTMYRKEVIKQDGLEFMIYVMNSTEPWEPSDSYLAIIAEGYEDWHLDPADLGMAVKQTIKETLNYDLQWSTHDGIGLDSYLEEPLRGQSSDDLRWLRDLRMANRDPETIQ